MLIQPPIAITVWPAMCFELQFPGPLPQYFRHVVWYQAGDSMSYVVDPSSTPSWDPRWAALAEHYRQSLCTDCPATASFATDITMLQQHWNTMNEDTDKDSTKDIFVDGLLLVQHNRPSSAGRLLDDLRMPSGIE